VLTEVYNWANKQSANMEDAIHKMRARSEEVRARIEYLETVDHDIELAIKYALAATDRHRKELTRNGFSKDEDYFLQYYDQELEKFFTVIQQAKL
jgi:hypothetical protein